MPHRNRFSVPALGAIALVGFSGGSLEAGVIETHGNVRLSGLRADGQELAFDYRLEPGGAWQAGASLAETAEYLDGSALQPWALAVSTGDEILWGLGIESGVHAVGIPDAAPDGADLLRGTGLFSVAAGSTGFESTTDVSGTFDVSSTDLAGMIPSPGAIGLFAAAAVIRSRVRRRDSM
jgi:hypothetical protein